MKSTSFDAAEKFQIATQDTTIFMRRLGTGPALLLLHGFPQTHLMWRDIAPRLASDFTVICADLRGYGQSGCPTSAPDHSTYSKRTMVADMVSVIDQLGFRTFSAAASLGDEHDRQYQKNARCIQCPLLALWFGRPVAHWTHGTPRKAGHWQSSASGLMR